MGFRASRRCLSGHTGLRHHSEVHREARTDAFCLFAAFAALR